MPRRLPVPTGAVRAWPELLPVEKLQQHGRHIYMFRNIQTNQVVYTLFPRLMQRTLKQLPFIGKHSVPPSIRPDHWTPYCRIGPFPSPEQGHHAFRKLREFRKLHELCWNETDPEWKRKSKKALIRAIMNQKANAVADLSKVLSIQRSQAKDMEERTIERAREQEQFLDKKWAALEVKATCVAEGKVEQLEEAIRKSKELLESDDTSKENNRLNAEISTHQRNIRELLWAQRMVQKRNERQAEIDAKYASLPNKPPNDVRLLLLTKLLKDYPQPFSLKGVEVHWADLYDAEFAQSWPDGIVHDTIASITNKRTNFITEDEWTQLQQDRKAARQAAAEKVIENMRREAEGLPPLGTAIGSKKPKKARKTGLWKYIPDLPTMRNPLRRAFGRA